ncbi:hypothetical protein HRbin11_01707 [bacterium HR11]|nr:hypothetical protein HRbin11_01707 [bacterium HR11]
MTAYQSSRTHRSGRPFNFLKAAIPRPIFWIGGGYCMILMANFCLNYVNKTIFYS